MKTKTPHTHHWWYPHVIIHGRDERETAVVRYCTCGARQVAFVLEKQWTKATGYYAGDEHYAA